MREVKEAKLDKLRAELVRAKEKSNEWQARVRDLEQQVTEQENLQIVQTVRGIVSEPEELRELLNMIRAAHQPPKPNMTEEV